MNPIDLPPDWTGWRSAAALMTLSLYVTQAADRNPQIQLIHWELEKYGPTFCEPAPGQLVSAAIAVLEQQVTQADLVDPREVGRFHASEVLRRRGREALDLALCASARAAALATATPAHTTWLHDLMIHARSRQSFDTADERHWLGDDEARDFADFEELRRFPAPDVFAGWMRRCVGLLDRPEDWSGAHALAFVAQAAHRADRATPPPMPERVQRFLASFAGAIGCEAPLHELLDQGLAMFERCEGIRFVLLRAVEDQLMHLWALEPKVRSVIVDIVNTLASESVTATRRAIITATMGVLATSPKADPRPRACVPWPPVPGRH